MANIVGGDNLIFTNVTEVDISKMPKNINPSNCHKASIEGLNLDIKKVCLLDQEASKVLSPEDIEEFDYLLFGGILGDEDTEAMECLVKDRTSELRKLGFPTRHLGAAQMTTDGAVLTSKIILEDKIPFEEIKFVDHPEVKVSKNESTIMPFRYVMDSKGKPIMAPGMVELFKNDTFDL
ncbi:hypothetical protein DSO57_1021780 [Entomophthora muscae]|nr:hypothetical protein DSO57_1021780 [Entomophthora muscae]